MSQPGVPCCASKYLNDHSLAWMQSRAVLANHVLDWLLLLCREGFTPRFKEAQKLYKEEGRWCPA